MKKYHFIPKKSFWMVKTFVWVFFTMYVWIDLRVYWSLKFPEINFLTQTYKNVIFYDKVMLTKMVLININVNINWIIFMNICFTETLNNYLVLVIIKLLLNKLSSTSINKNFILLFQMWLLYRINKEVVIFHAFTLIF